MKAFTPVEWVIPNLGRGVVSFQGIANINKVTRAQRLASGSTTSEITPLQTQDNVIFQLLCRDRPRRGGQPSSCQSTFMTTAHSPRSTCQDRDLFFCLLGCAHNRTGKATSGALRWWPVTRVSLESFAMPLHNAPIRQRDRHNAQH